MAKKNKIGALQEFAFYEKLRRTVRELLVESTLDTFVQGGGGVTAEPMAYGQNSPIAMDTFPQGSQHIMANKHFEEIAKNYESMGVPPEEVEQKALEDFSSKYPHLVIFL